MGLKSNTSLRSWQVRSACRIGARSNLLLGKAFPMRRKAHVLSLCGLLLGFSSIASAAGAANIQSADPLPPDFGTAWSTTPTLQLDDSQPAAAQDWSVYPDHFWLKTP